MSAAGVTLELCSDLSLEMMPHPLTHGIRPTRFLESFVVDYVLAPLRKTVAGQTPNVFSDLIVQSFLVNEPAVDKQRLQLF